MWESIRVPSHECWVLRRGGAVQDGTEIESTCPMQVHEFRHNILGKSILGKSTSSRAGLKGYRLLESTYTIPRTNVGGF